MNELEERIIKLLLDGGFVVVQRAALESAEGDLRVEIEKPDDDRPAFVRLLRKVEGCFISEEIARAQTFLPMALELAQHARTRRSEQLLSIERLLGNQQSQRLGQSALSAQAYAWYSAGFTQPHQVQRWLVRADVDKAEVAKALKEAGVSVREAARSDLGLWDAVTLGRAVCEGFVTVLEAVSLLEGLIQGEELCTGRRPSGARS